jgi:hypothetical protein
MGDITNRCKKEFQQAHETFDAIAQIRPRNRTLNNTLLIFEQTIGNNSDKSGPALTYKLQRTSAIDPAGSSRSR